MSNPFFWLTNELARSIVLTLLIAITIAFMIELSKQGKTLKCNAVPSGIGSFELAWNKDHAQNILVEWKSMIDVAITQLHWDFGFLVFYPFSMSLACAMLADSSLNRLPNLGQFFSWAMLLAGLLDACENLALLQMLKQRAASEFLEKSASLCAGVKFLIVFAGLGYVIVQGSALIVARIKGHVG